MAIAFDASSNGTQAAPASSLTYSFTVGNGSNRCLIVEAKMPSAGDVTGVTYNSVAMTKIDEQVSTGGLGGVVQLWYLVNPDIGAHNVVVTASGSVSFLASTCSSYFGVDQTNPINASAKGVTDSSTSRTQSVTSTVDGCWLVAGFCNQVGTASAGTNATLRGDNGAYASSIADRGQKTATAGSDSIQLTVVSAGNWGSVGAMLAPTSAINFDSAIDGGRTSSASSKTFSFNNVAGDCVVVYARNPNGVTPTGVTYNSVAMTLVASYNNGADHQHNMYVLTGPATGSNNVVISYSGSQSFIDAGAVSYSGVDQTTPCPANDTTNHSTGNSLAASMTTTKDNSWVIACVGNSTGQSTAGANTAERWANANGNGFYDSGTLVASAGSRTINMNRGTSSAWTSVLAELAVAVASTANKSNFFALF